MEILTLGQDAGKIPAERLEGRAILRRKNEDKEISWEPTCIYLYAPRPRPKRGEKKKKQKNKNKTKIVRHQPTAVTCTSGVVH